MLRPYRFAGAVVVASLMALGGTQAAHASAVFDLRGNGGAQPSYSLTHNGLTLNITASATNHAGVPYYANPHQSTNGMGVLNSGGLSDGEGVSGDDPAIDSVGLTDTLWLNFSEEVTLESAMFGEVGDPFGSDEANFTDGQGNDLASVTLNSNFIGVDIVNFSDAGIDLTGQTFGIAAGEQDSFRLKKLAATATPVPSPGAAGAGLALMSLLALRRRGRASVASA